MIFGQDLGEYMQGVLSFVIIAAVSTVLQHLTRWDKTAEGDPRYTQVTVPGIVVLCAGNSVLVCLLTDSLILLVLLSFFAACLLTACVMDVETHLIYNYVWWIAGTAALAMLLLKKNTSEVWVGLLCFWLLQELFFARMYGRADCHGFVVCAMAESALGFSIREYLIHMLLAFMMLAIVQLLRKNIARNGNLKEPVPFLPYITCGFWMMFFIESELC